ncbi:hypothetical protein F5Y17DRAFT_432600 [Xylariaceae sp. FL0594]|nr:hypothetical protein F5Y17DRAFT_432600 [Xylariaceae sp. FL0594]
MGFLELSYAMIVIANMPSGEGSTTSIYPCISIHLTSFVVSSWFLAPILLEIVHMCMEGFDRGRRVGTCFLLCFFPPFSFSVYLSFPPGRAFFRSQRMTMGLITKSDSLCCTPYLLPASQTPLADFTRPYRDW